MHLIFYPQSDHEPQTLFKLTTIVPIKVKSICVLWQTLGTNLTLWTCVCSWINLINSFYRLWSWLHCVRSVEKITKIQQIIHQVYQHLLIMFVQCSTHTYLCLWVFLVGKTETQSTQTWVSVMEVQQPMKDNIIHINKQSVISPARGVSIKIQDVK